MREILFKAKTKGGKWIEGDLIHYESGEVAILEKFSKYGYEATEICRRTKVQVDTVCQYTGLKDKNGRKIWEGDILIATDPYYPNEKFYLKYDKEVISFIGIYIGFEKLFHVHKELLENCEVIGNIFDNKELLEN